MELDSILKRDYPRALSMERREDGTEIYAAFLVDAPGCIAQGSSPEEASKRLEAVERVYFEKLLEIGAPVPDATPFPSIVPGKMAFYDETSGAFAPASISEMTGEHDIRDLKLETV